MDYEAMANEELAARARSGDKDAEGVLWENVYRLVQTLTRRYLTHCAAAGMEPDDMMQDCWIGFHNAVMGYQPGRSLFTSYLGFHIKKVCMNALHIQNGKIRQVPTVPIDAPVMPGEELTILDTLEDETVHIADDCELTDLQRVVRGAVSRLPDREQDLIYHVYALGGNVADWAAGQQIGRSRGTQIHSKALRTLRKDPAIQAFLPFYSSKEHLRRDVWELLYHLRRRDDWPEIEPRIDREVSAYLAWCADNGISADEAGKRREIMEYEAQNIPVSHYI